MSVLLTGFGPFPGVDDNPSARLVWQLAGRRVRGETVLTRVLDVSYSRGPAEAIAVARVLQPRLVLGFGVTQGKLRVEELGRARCNPDVADVDGVRLERLEGPEEVPATADTKRLARFLAARRSQDAGGYVCNAWLHTVVPAIEAPAAFVHIPPDGIRPSHVLRALDFYLR